MELRIGDIIINGLIVEVYENVPKEQNYAEGDWRGDKIYIYDGLGDAPEEEIDQIIEYLYNEGFILDRRTDYEVLRPDNFE